VFFVPEKRPSSNHITTTIHHDLHHKKPSPNTPLFQNTPQKHPQTNKKSPANRQGFFLQIKTVNQP
jgi:hypothetical protein